MALQVKLLLYELAFNMGTGSSAGCFTSDSAAWETAEDDSGPWDPCCASERPKWSFRLLICSYLGSEQGDEGLIDLSNMYLSPTPSFLCNFDF